MRRKFSYKVIPSTWLESNGRRLDCGPYMSGAVEARELLKKFHKESLETLTNGIFHAGRESRAGAFPHVRSRRPEDPGVHHP